jgi:hypothetical protein
MQGQVPVIQFGEAERESAVGLTGGAAGHWKYVRPAPSLTGELAATM